MTERVKFQTTRTRAGMRIRFIWYGGPYIDICYGGSIADDVINLVDYETGEYRVENRQDFIREVDEYLDDLTDEEILNNVQNYRGF